MVHFLAQRGDVPRRLDDAFTSIVVLVQFAAEGLEDGLESSCCRVDFGHAVGGDFRRVIIDQMAFPGTFLAGTGHSLTLQP